MLTRIRNAARSKMQEVKIPASKMKRGIAEVLKQEGYIEDFDQIDDGRQGLLRIQLKYGPLGESVITSLDRASSPGRRLYKPVNDIPRVLNGLGIAIISTSQGVLSDRVCREKNVGGELVCTVY
jgi:small subunit ribosomal protein S8